jgi:hypothetical protein
MEDINGEKFDLVECTDEYLEIEPELEAKIEKEMLKCGYGTDELPNPCLGSCHVYWSIKKSILKWDYGIKWKSPKELNPNIRYD